MNNTYMRFRYARVIFAISYSLLVTLLTLEPHLIGVFVALFLEAEELVFGFSRRIIAYALPLPW